MQLKEVAQQVGIGGEIFNRFIRRMDGAAITALVSVLGPERYALMILINYGDRKEEVLAGLDEIEKRIKQFKDYDPNNWQEAEL